MRIFLYESPVSQALVKIVNIIGLTVLWFAFCLPVFTIGASTAAFYYTIRKNIRNNRGQVMSCFWDSFKTNFRQSIGMTLLLVAFEAVFYFDMIICRYLLDNGNAIGNLYVIFIIVMILMLAYASWVFFTLSQYSNTTRQILRNAFILMIRHLGTTCVILLLEGFAALCLYLVPITFFFMPAVVLWIISVPVDRVFNEYAESAKNDNNADW